MPYDFNFKRKELDGKESEETLGKALADFLGSETSGNTLKLFGWYTKLSANEPLELDEADKKMLVSMIENSNRVYVFVKGQLLEVLK